MLWLIPFLCSGAICWLNRDRIAAVASPSRMMARPAFAAGPFASPYLLPRAAAGYGSTPYGTGQLLLPQHAGSPAATPFAYANAPAAPPFAYASAPPDPSAFMSPSVSAPSAPATGPIAVMRCAADGCMIRPEPRPWDDATLGRMPGAFTAPKDFQVYVLSYGPVGWAHVLVNHPDEGAVEGWVEMRSLTDAPLSPPPMAPATPSMSSTTSATAGTGQAVDGKGDAMVRHQQFMAKRGPGRAMPSPPPRRRR